MTIALKIPEIGESIQEAEIGQWLKSEGDEVRKDEPIATLESEKASIELPAPASGRLERILKRPGETVKVGDEIARIAEAGEAEPGGRQEQPVAAPREPEQPPEPRRPRPRLVTGPMPQPGGRQEKPVPAPARPAAAPAAARDGEEAVRMSPLRRALARRLVAAQREAALLTTFAEVDCAELAALRRRCGEAFQAKHGVKLGVMAFFIRAAVLALREFPQLNAEIRGDDLVTKRRYDIGVAVATERGLVVPVLRAVEGEGFAAIERRLAELAERARAGKLEPAELEGGSFTISNGGVFGSLLSTPIVNPPQTGILGLHAIEDRPVARDGGVVVRPMMYAALTYDHRAVDGREAVLFLRRVADAIADPARMLLEV